LKDLRSFESISSVAVLSTIDGSPEFVVTASVRRIDGFPHFAAISSHEFRSSESHQPPNERFASARFQSSSFFSTSVDEWLSSLFHPSSGFSESPPFGLSSLFKDSRSYGGRSSMAASLQLQD
jgi:hypothetical protein